MDSPTIHDGGSICTARIRTSDVTSGVRGRWTPQAASAPCHFRKALARTVPLESSPRGTGVLDSSTGKRVSDFMEMSFPESDCEIAGHGGSTLDLLSESS